jgi:hypothetical protein
VAIASYPKRVNWSHCRSSVGRSATSASSLTEHVSLYVNAHPGTRVTANFLRYDYGAQVQIALDGSNATQVDTYAVPGLASDGTACTPIQYISDVLSAKQHTINVTVLGARSGVSRPYVHIHSFMYVINVASTPKLGMSISHR